MEAQDTRIGNTILGILERLWRRTQSMDSRVRVTTCKTGNRRLLDKVFKSKPIKRGIKFHLNSPRNYSNSKALLQMSFQTANNNIFITAPIFPNPYIS